MRCYALPTKGKDSMTFNLKSFCKLGQDAPTGRLPSSKVINTTTSNKSVRSYGVSEVYPLYSFSRRLRQQSGWRKSDRASSTPRLKRKEKRSLNHQLELIASWNEKPTHSHIVFDIKQNLKETINTAISIISFIYQSIQTSNRNDRERIGCVFFTKDLL